MRLIFSLFMLSAFISAPLHAQDADQIVAEHVKAIGGLGTWNNIKDMTMEITITMPEVTFASTVKSMRPNLNYTRAFISAMALEILEGYDGEVAWQVNPMQGGKMKKSPEQTEEMRKKAFDGVLIDYKKKGHTVEYQETVTTDGKPCYKLLVTKADGDQETYFIDTESYYLIREETEFPATSGSEASTAIFIYSDHREVNGVTMAFTIHANNGTVKQEINVSSIVFNTGLKKSDFSMPK